MAKVKHNPATTIKVGSFFIDQADHLVYILAQVGERLVCLVSLSDGNRYRDGFLVKATDAIEIEEMDMIAGNASMQPIYSGHITISVTSDGAI